MRRQFSGALPLLKQEKFAETMNNLQEEKVKIEEQFKKVSTLQITCREEGLTLVDSEPTRSIRAHSIYENGKKRAQNPDRSAPLNMFGFCQ